MAGDKESFLPRIQSVFYSVFDLRQGPKIVYQVPEGLIAVPSAGRGLANSISGIVSSGPSSTSLSSATSSEVIDNGVPNSRNSSSSLMSPTSQRPGSRSLHSPQKRSTSSNRILFNFDDISKYVIPPSPLCGRLVTCATRNCRIIGVPVELRGKYERSYFRYNLCFVFERTADLSCYEPIVRKVSRVLTSCEEESAFLSSPHTSPALHGILEQLYEDLNSYSETSIPIDRFNSIELKIFPFYPNPPAVSDWMVPVALINLSKRVESNWDLTMVKVCRYIDGTNHVSRIAHLADCDLDLTRQAISHLLYYQVIMTIDIFQYSNMYTLRKSMQWLADEPHVKEECGPYVTKPSKPIPDWPRLLHLYSRLKSGQTVLEWMDAHDIHALGIDARRFTSFGVIKGFLRRVHRWPFLPPGEASLNSTFTGRQRNKSFSTASTSFFSPEAPSQGSDHSLRRNFPGRLPDTAASMSGEHTTGVTGRGSIGAIHYSQTLPRRVSAAEAVLQQLQSRDTRKIGTLTSPRSSRIRHTREDGHEIFSESRRHSLVLPTSSTPFPNASLAAFNISTSQSTYVPPSPIPARPRPSRSPSTPIIPQSTGTSTSPGTASSIPEELLPLLDGEHHTDELAVRFEAGWPLLEQWLIAIGEGKGEGDFGKVSIIYR